MKGVLILLCCYLAGEGMAMVLGGFMPGSVLGMILLFALLKYNVVPSETVKGSARFLLDNLMLFFVPVSVGLMTSYKLLGESWLHISIILTLSTVIVLITVGLIQQRIGRRK